MHTTDYRRTMGKIIRGERLKHGWTQEELAEKMDLHPSFVGQMERGLKAASLDTLKRLSAIFGIKPADLLKESNPLQPPAGAQSVERKIINLLKGCTSREQEAVYQTIKYILRKKRKISN